MLHVLRFVHADGQLDPQVAVRAAFGHGHLVELRLFGTVGGWMEHHLEAPQSQSEAIHNQY